MAQVEIAKVFTPDGSINDAEISRQFDEIIVKFKQLSVRMEQVESSISTINGKIDTLWAAVFP